MQPCKLATRKLTSHCRLRQRPKILGNQGIQAKKQIAAKDCHTIKQDGAHAHGPNGSGAIREMAHGNRVDEVHAEPAQLGKSQRRGQTEHGPEFLAHLGKMKHSLQIYHIWGWEEGLNAWL